MLRQMLDASQSRVLAFCAAKKSSSARSCRRAASPSPVVHGRRRLPHRGCERVDHLCGQVARRRPLAADGGEQIRRPIVLAMVDQLGAAAGAIGVARAVVHQRPQARIEMLDVARASARAAGKICVDEGEEASDVGLGHADRVGRAGEGGVGRAEQRVPAPRQHEEVPACPPPPSAQSSRVIAGTSRWMPLERSSLCDVGLPSARVQENIGPRPGGDQRQLRAHVERCVAERRRAPRAFDLAVAHEQRLRPRHNSRSPRHARPHRSGIPAPAARANTSARRNSGTRRRSRARPAPARRQRRLRVEPANGPAGAAPDRRASRGRRTADRRASGPRRASRAPCNPPPYSGTRKGRGCTRCGAMRCQMRRSRSDSRTRPNSKLRR